ncbi:MAG: protein kinase [Polyangiaceae bacterium]
MAEKSRFNEGDVIAGKYRVERVLGAGGMGVVLAAHHLGLDKMVAVKFLLPEMLGHHDVVARFAREARAAARITNEHVARVFDVGALDDGAPYLVMEFLDGIDLGQWLKERGPLPTAQAVDFLLQGCEAVAEAHDLGIVHRDLKPANMFWTRRLDGGPCIKVLDFGISKFSGIGDRSGSNLSFTRTAAVVGTPFYMSPEQMESSKEVDGRSDIWALGVILFELLTGKVPFDGQTLPEVCVKIATHSPPPIRRIRGDAPEGIEKAILRCLEKDREKRFQSVAELATTLAPFGTEHAADSAIRMQRVMGGPARRSGPLAQSAQVEPKRLPMGESLGALGLTKAVSLRRRTALLSLLALAALIGVVTAAFVLVSRRDETGPHVLPPSVAAAPPPSSPAEVTTQTRLRTLEEPATDAGAPPSGAEERRHTEPARSAPRTAKQPKAPAPADSTDSVKPAGSAKNGKATGAESSPRTNPEPAAGSNAFDERL